MSVTFDDTLKDLANDAIADCFAGGTLQYRTGTAPGASNTATGVVLATITLPDPAWAPSSGGVAAKTGTWEDASADATGTIGYARFIALTGEIMEGDVTETGDGGDIEVDSLAVVSGNDVVVVSCDLGSTN